MYWINHRSSAQASFQIVRLLTAMLLLTISCTCGKNKNPGTKTDNDASSQESECTNSKTKRAKPIALKLKPVKNSDMADYYLVIALKVQETGADLSQYFVSADIADGKGSLLAAHAKNNNKLQYEVDLQQPQSISQLLTAKGDANSFKQGKQIQIKCKYLPMPGAKQGEAHNLTISISKKDSGGQLIEKAQESTVIIIKKEDKMDLSVQELAANCGSEHCFTIAIKAEVKEADINQYFIHVKALKGQGILWGATEKTRHKFQYQLPLQEPQCIAKLLPIEGSSETQFKAGKAFKFRGKYKPDANAKQGDENQLMIIISKRNSEDKVIQKEKTAITFQIKAGQQFDTKGQQADHVFSKQGNTSVPKANQRSNDSERQTSTQSSNDLEATASSHHAVGEYSSDQSNLNQSGLSDQETTPDNAALQASTKHTAISSNRDVQRAAKDTENYDQQGKKADQSEPKDDIANHNIQYNKVVPEADSKSNETNIQASINKPFTQAKPQIEISNDNNNKKPAIYGSIHPTTNLPEQYQAEIGRLNKHSKSTSSSSTSSSSTSTNSHSNVQTIKPELSAENKAPTQVAQSNKLGSKLSIHQDTELPQVHPVNRLSEEEVSANISKPMSLASESHQSSPNKQVSESTKNNTYIKKSAPPRMQDKLYDVEPTNSNKQSSEIPFLNIPSLQHGLGANLNPADHLQWLQDSRNARLGGRGIRNLWGILPFRQKKEPDPSPNPSQSTNKLPDDPALFEYFETIDSESAMRTASRIMASKRAEQEAMRQEMEALDAAGKAMFKLKISYFTQDRCAVLMDIRPTTKNTDPNHYFILAQNLEGKGYILGAKKDYDNEPKYSLPLYQEICINALIPEKGTTFDRFQQGENLLLKGEYRLLGLPNKNEPHRLAIIFRQKDEEGNILQEEKKPIDLVFAWKK